MSSYIHMYNQVIDGNFISGLCTKLVKIMAQACTEHANTARSSASNFSTQGRHSVRTCLAALDKALTLRDIVRAEMDIVREHEDLVQVLQDSETKKLQGETDRLRQRFEESLRRFEWEFLENVSDMNAVV